jgi:tRNA pseudouridine13 synthase
MALADAVGRQVFAFPGAGGRARGRIRCVPEDFRVAEVLGFEPEGQGEHLFLRVRKREANTEWVAARLARATGRSRAAIGYAGMKDRHALSEQWFSLHWPEGELPDLAGLASEGIELLSAQRHRRKLKRGALKGNCFGLRVRDLRGDRDDVVRRLDRVAVEGFPNYFGEQRFGRDRTNLPAALTWFEAGLPRSSRHRRSLLLSAARAWLFNLVLDARVRDGSWNRLLPGEVLCLAGSRSFFPSEGQTGLEERLSSGDVHPSGPLWGRGEPPTAGECLELERSVARQWDLLARGLEAGGLSQERRPLRILPEDLRWAFAGPDVLELHFALPAGAYATSLLQAVLDIEESGA